MKHQHHTHNTAPQRVPMHFEFTHPTAIAICVAGAFNDWHPTTNARQSSGAGNWLKETSLTPGAYEYCFVMDGRWMPNPFGGKNSILNVATSPQAAHLAEAATLPLKNANKPKTRKL